VDTTGAEKRAEKRTSVGIFGGLTLDVARQTGTAAVVQLGKQGLRVSRDQLVQP
jgi:hypothetical protein